MRGNIAVDGWLFFAVATLLVVGITMVLSTSYLYSQERFSDGTYLFRKQFIAVGIGMTALIVSALVPAPAYRRRGTLSTWAWKYFLKVRNETSTWSSIA